MSAATDVYTCVGECGLESTPNEWFCYFSELDGYICRECLERLVVEASPEENDGQEDEPFDLGLPPVLNLPLNGNGNGHRAPAKTKTTGKLTVLDTHEMLTTAPPSIEWLADGVFARGKFTLFGGREKGGKSLVQLAIGAAMASGGIETAGITVKPGKVLLIDAENGKDEIHRRLRALGLDVAHSANLVVAEARGIDLRNDLGQIKALVTEYSPDLVLLDSFRSLWRGSEKDEDEIANALYPVADLAHEGRIAVSLTHHATKRDGGDYRGSTAIGAVPDWIVMLARYAADPLKATRRVLTTPYVRFAAERPPRWMEIQSTSDDGPVSVVDADAYEPEQETPVVDELERKLVSSCRTPKGYDNYDNDNPPAWTKTELCEALGKERNDKSANQAIDRLIARGVLYQNGKKWSPADKLFDTEEES